MKSLGSVLYGTVTRLLRGIIELGIYMLKIICPFLRWLIIYEWNKYKTC